MTETIQNLIITFGYFGIFAVIFAESGFLLGFFLPGDSLLFTVGLLASQGYFNIWILVPVSMVCAILGDNFGYWCGLKFGSKIFNREDSFFFHRKHVDRTKAFYETHGKKTIILARFIPVVRTFAPILAGVGKMNYRIFFLYNVLGGILWAGGILIAGFYLGKFFPGLDRYILLIVIIIAFTSVIPILSEYFKAKKNQNSQP